VSARSPKFGTTLALWLVVIAGIIYLILSVFRAANVATLRVGERSYRLEIAKTSAAQQKGLGGRVSLLANQGMLFEFGAPAQRCFWMKDMRFSLDIIWFSGTKQVEHIEANVNPSTYPKIFCPTQPAQYVIELNAGQTYAAGIAVGQTLNF